ncbi:glycerol-3-phosphate 1-O-acyltransferase [Oceanospirillum multiglobuliferum]|uniref:Glycerol-3-phosphate acyltransferase n=2 Tax=Oceanospirillum multiglobuliferum TaxID=64969 RepID=A0A1V4T9L0_9GAMM|nr:glycerol-3-phosphate 1-O-acyltransferase [Oceanospirillum multiglobuliferum]
MRPARSATPLPRIISTALKVFLSLLEWVLMRLVRVRYQGKPPSIKADDTNPVKYCYVLPENALSDQLLVNHLSRALKLPPADQAITENKHWFGIQEQSALITLHRSQSRFSARTDRQVSPRLIRLTAHLLEHPEQDLHCIPVTIFWGRAPGQTQSKLHQQWLSTGPQGRMTQMLSRLWHILWYGRDTLVHFAEPVSLQGLIASSPVNTSLNRHVRKTARLMRVHFQQIRKGVAGPELTDRNQLLHALTRSPRVKAAILKQVQTDKKNQAQLEAKAHQYADEIVANVSYSTQQIFDRLLSWLWNKLYDGISIHNIEPVQEAAKNSTLVYVPCHRSHIDYLLLSYALYQHNLVPPHVAAGINLNLPIVGRLLRRGGAFFLRRSFKDNPLYAAVFAEYYFYLLNKGYATEYFVEGGRSRTGRTLAPKAGMLSLTIQGFLRNPHRQIKLVPVYIGYEKVIEAGTYLGELRGQKKKSESIVGLIRAMKALKEPFGKVSLAFGEPINLADTLSAQISDTGWNQAGISTEKPEWLSQAVNQLAEQVAVGINQAATLNSVNLSALALLTSRSHTLEESSLKQFIQLCITLQQDLNPQSAKTVQSTDALIQEVEQLGLLNRIPHQYGDLLQLTGENALLMTWYRNNILHLFALPSLIAFCFSQQPRYHRGQLQQLISVLYPLIQKELYLSWPMASLAEQVDRYLNWFIRHELLIADGEHLTCASTYQTQGRLLQMLSKPIQASMERCYLMVALLLHHGSGQLSTSTLEQLCQNLAQRLTILHGLNAPEYFHSPLFQQLIKVLYELNYLKTDQNQKLSFDQRLELLAVQCRGLFDPAIRHSIRQLTQIKTT